MLVLNLTQISGKLRGRTIVQGDPMGYSNTDSQTQEVCMTREEEVLITKQLR